MKKVSIIIAAYNVEKYISKCLDSVCNQTYKNTEIIIVNDGSTDGTIQIVKEYAKKFTNIVIMDQANQGANMARKNGLDIATGEYILFVDSDDWIEKDALEKLMNINNDIDIIKFRFWEPDNSESSKIFEGQKLINSANKKNIYKLLIESSKLNPIWNQLIKIELAKENYYLRKMSQGEDILNNMSFFYKANKILFVNDILYHHCENKESTTKIFDYNKVFRNVKEIFYVYEEKAKYVEKYKLDSNVENKIIANSLMQFLVGEIFKIYRSNISIDKINDIYNYIFDNEFYNQFIYRNLNYNSIYNENRIKLKYMKMLYKKNTTKMNRNIRIIKLLYNIKEMIK